MKHLLILTCLLFTVSATMAQSADDKHKEKKARDLHKTLLSGDREEWKKFIKENFTQEFVERPMQAKTTEEGQASTENKAKGTIDAKLDMFQRLHDDFGSSKIKSVKVEGDQATMNVTDSDGLSGTFKLKFVGALIDRMGIQLER